MKIAIVTAYYFPIPNPRAFRATELAEELAKRGHYVTVYNATQIESYNYNTFETYNGHLKLVNMDVLTQNLNSQNGNISGKMSLSIFSFIRKLTYYFTTNTWLTFYNELKKKLKFEEHYDLLVSIALPFHIHWGVGRLIDGRNIADCYVADYGDPFSKYNHSINVAKYFKLIEYKIISRFDYITVPTELAINSYLWLKKRDKIKVIPQGFDFSKVIISIYNPNKIPTFAYAGLFYSNIRNPKIFFNYLCELKFDFRFIVYTSLSATDSYSCLEPYLSLLKEKLIIKDIIPRLNLINELSKVDFIININNISSNQIPSKLIDYTLSKRPIFSLSQENFNSIKFTEFMKGNYNGSEIIEIEQFNIVKVAKQFEILLKREEQLT